MDIEEAIENNKALKGNLEIQGSMQPSVFYEGYEKAIQLGIEALERFKVIRETPYVEWLRSMSELRKPLPSETAKEGE